MVRHANTTMDNKVDALLDPPLDEEGVERIKRTIQFLDAEKIKPSRIISSPLQRALRVAQMISRGNIQVTPNNAALPWNLGDLMGKLTTTTEPKIDFYKNYPDLRVPHGESYRTFYLRWTEFLAKLMQFTDIKDEPIMVTTHSRNVNALQSFIDGNPVGDVQELAPEASVTLLAKNGVSEWSQQIIWDGK